MGGEGLWVGGGDGGRLEVNGGKQRGICNTFNNNDEKKNKRWHLEKRMNKVMNWGKSALGSSRASKDLETGNSLVEYV